MFHTPKPQNSEIEDVFNWMCQTGFSKNTQPKNTKKTSTWECYSDLVGFRNSAQHDPDISRPSVSLGAKKKPPPSQDQTDDSRGRIKQQQVRLPGLGRMYGDLMLMILGLEWNIHDLTEGSVLS
jgi:hypothetical protein